jgi:hypothetical protein
LNTSLVFSRNDCSLMHDSSEWTACESLELVLSQRRPVPLGGGYCHRLIATLFGEDLLDNGLAEGRLEPDHSSLNAGDRLHDHRLWGRCLEGSIGDEEEQQRSEYDCTHSDTYDDVGGVVAVRHNDLLSTQGQLINSQRAL